MSGIMILEKENIETLVDIVENHVNLKGKCEVALLEETGFTKESFVQKMLCRISGVDEENVKSGNLTEGQWKSLERAAQKLSAAKVWISEREYDEEELKTIYRGRSGKLYYKLVDKI